MPRPRHPALRRAGPLAVIAVGALLLAACGASSSWGVSDHAAAPVEDRAVVLEASAREQATRGAAAARHARPDGAMLDPEPTAADEAFAAADGDVETRDDAHRGPVLIYTGTLVLQVFQVEREMERAIAHVESIGGFAQARGRTHVVLRIPSASFLETLEHLQQDALVTDVQWQAEDVGEAYRDLQIRLRNLRALRDRLETLLEAAESVEDLLRVERELERVTLEIERILGQLRGLEDRIAYATLTLRFGARQQGGAPGAHRLPFPFLNQLGLPALLRL